MVAVRAAVRAVSVLPSALAQRSVLAVEVAVVVRAAIRKAVAQASFRWVEGHTKVPTPTP